MRPVLIGQRRPATTLSLKRSYTYARFTDGGTPAESELTPGRPDDVCLMTVIGDVHFAVANDDSRRSSSSATLPRARPLLQLPVAEVTNCRCCCCMLPLLG